MARKGSFGTSLNPFGAGTFGGLAQYSIGDNLKDLAAYSAEIAWGNGQLTDAEYAASLAGLVAAADPGTQALLSAQNKLDDVTYRIGRSQADAAGLDALIAFDQQELAGMNPDNLRYRTVKSALDGELAQRRSRDYGKIREAYDAGLTSTESLLEWVENTLATLPADAPDKDNWESVQANLIDVVVNEKDAQVYQDYQDRKMAPADFLAYLSGRRDAYDPSSPKWDEADRRLKDAEKNVKDTALVKRDQDVFNRYAEGKVSDATYLKYISSRIDGMEPGDPALPEWKHKLTQMAHSLAEDKFRHEVNIATAGSNARSAAAHTSLPPTAAETTARKNLLAFYEAYARTLNPGSAEARATEENIVSLKGSISSGGGGGGTAAVKGKVVVNPKIINPTGKFDAILTLLTPNANAPKKDQAIAVANLDLNLDSAKNAEHDKVWLYFDPRFPSQTVAMRTPDGKLVKDANDKQVYTRGSAYRPVSSDEVALMQEATAKYQFAVATIALDGGGVGGKVVAGGNFKAYWSALDKGIEALDASRTTRAHAVQVDIEPELIALDKGIEIATKLNDSATVINLLTKKGEVILRAREDGSLDQAQVDRLNTKGLLIEDNPLLPTWETDINGEKVYGKDGKRIQTGGAVDIRNSPTRADGSLISGLEVYNPGWHFILKTNEQGAYDPGRVWEDPQREWSRPDRYVTVQTGHLGVVVTGDVRVADASIAVWATTQDGVRKPLPFGLPVKYAAYTDGYGNRVAIYSLDGKTWVQATGGYLPELDLGDVVWTDTKDPKTGAVIRSVVTQNGVYLFTETGQVNPAFPMDKIDWFGLAAFKIGWDPTASVGADGQRFRIVELAPGPDGLPSLNFIPTVILRAEATAARNVNQMLRVNAVAQEEAQLRATSPAGIAAAAQNARQMLRVNAEPGEQARLDAATGEATAARNIAQMLRINAEPRGGRTAGGGTWAFDTGSQVSALSAAVTPPSTLAGIINLGATPLSAITPPWSLPPVWVEPYQPYVPIPLPALLRTEPYQPYLPPVKVTAPAITAARRVVATPVVKPKLVAVPTPVVKPVVTPKPVSTVGMGPRAL